MLKSLQNTWSGAGLKSFGPPACDAVEDSLLWLWFGNDPKLMTDHFQPFAHFF
jgi:hypothetical protein